MDYQQLSQATGVVLVEIDGGGVEQGRTYTDKTTGASKPLPGRQRGYVWQGGKYPAEVSIDIPDGKGPYAPGWYFFGGPIFQGGDYGRLNFKGSRELALVSVDEVLDRAALAGPKAKAA